MHDEPEYQAMVAEIEADMAAQLARVRHRIRSSGKKNKTSPMGSPTARKKVTMGANPFQSILRPIAFSYQTRQNANASSVRGAYLNADIRLKLPYVSGLLLPGRLSAMLAAELIQVVVGPPSALLPSARPLENPPSTTARSAGAREFPQDYDAYNGGK